MMIETDTPTELENKNYEPSPELLNPPEKQSSSSLDLGSFTTPEKTENPPLTTNGCSYGCGCLCIILIVLAVIGAIIAPQESQTQNKSNIGDQKVEARVKLEQSIKANLREPKSYENIAIDVYTVPKSYDPNITTNVNTNEEYLFVKNTFRGKNLFGGYEICTFVARFDFNTKPLEWGITNNPRSNSGCRNIMIALP